MHVTSTPGTSMRFLFLVQRSFMVVLAHISVLMASDIILNMSGGARFLGLRLIARTLTKIMIYTTSLKIGIILILPSSAVY